MKFPLYHRVHNEMKGDTLYPLNVLKTVYPELYEKYRRKYSGREEVLDQKIPILDCLWNDAIHLSAIHPREAQKALKEIGIEFSGEFFVIDAEQLDSENLVVWTNVLDTEKGDMGAKDIKYFERFNADCYESLYKIFPKERQMKAWKKYMEENNTNPLIWSRCPHVLYKGEISLKNVEIISI